MPQGPSAPTAPLDLVGLRPLMALSRGAPTVAVGVVDGPVAAHPALAAIHLHRLGPTASAALPALRHGTFVAGLLAAICPACTLLSRPIFGAPAADGTVAATADGLAAAIRHALCGPARRRSIVPPLLDAWAAWQSLIGGTAHGTGPRPAA